MLHLISNYNTSSPALVGIMKMIKMNKEELIKRIKELESDIKVFEKYKGTDDFLNVMDEDLDKLKKKLVDIIGD